MSAQWSQSTLLRRMEQEFKGMFDEVLIGSDGEPTDMAGDVTVAEFAKRISRQIVVEQMTGRKSKVLAKDFKTFGAAVAVDGEPT